MPAVERAAQVALLEGAAQRCRQRSRIWTDRPYEEEGIAVDCRLRPWTEEHGGLLILEKIVTEQAARRSHDAPAIRSGAVYGRWPSSCSTWTGISAAGS